MEIAEALGYLASGLVFLAFCMKTMIPLRIVAIASNLAFVCYGLIADLLPIVLLHSILLPLNTLRLFQMHQLLKKIRDAAKGDLSLDGLLPIMTRRRFRQGERLFRKGEIAHEMYYVVSAGSGSRRSGSRSAQARCWARSVSSALRAPCAKATASCS